MKPFLLLIALVLLYITGTAQSLVDKQITDKVAKLKEEGVNTLVCYNRYCIGSVRLIKSSDTSCYEGDPQYVLWKKNKVHYVQKFDGCRQYPIQTISKEFLTTVAAKYKKIKQEEIRPPTFDSFIKGRKHEMVTYVDHSCHTEFKFFISSISFQKNIDDFDLETKYVSDKYSNKFYKYNRNTTLNKLKTIIEAELKRLNL